MSNELRVFPAGVRSGHPFSMPTEAVEWLCAAAAGLYGPLTPIMYGLQSWNTAPALALRPLYPQEVPDVVETWDGVAQGRADAAYIPSTLGNRSSEAAWFKVSDTAPTPLRLPASPQTPDRALATWRTFTGAEILVRSRFNDADKPERRILAPILGQYERATETTAAALVDGINRWVCASWSDALNDTSVPVIPDPTPGGSLYPPPTSPAGIPRIGR